MFKDWFTLENDFVVVKRNQLRCDLTIIDVKPILRDYSKKKNTASYSPEAVNVEVSLPRDRYPPFPAYYAQWVWKRTILEDEYNSIDYDRNSSDGLFVNSATDYQLNDTGFLNTNEKKQQ